MTVEIMPVRENLWGEHVNTHHNPGWRAEMVNCQPRVMVTMPEVGPDLLLKHAGVEQVSYPMTRAWVWDDGLPPGAGSTPGEAARRWLDELLRQRGWLVEAGERAEGKGKKVGVVVTNEYFPSEPVLDGPGAAGQAERIRFFGDFSAAVLEGLRERLPGVWGVVGNWPMGNITQGWWDLFFTPRLAAALRAGLGALGVHEYFYAHPASLMKYRRGLSSGSPDGETTFSFLAGSFMPEAWPVPVPAPDEIIEAHLIGRTFAYVDLPGWIPVFVLECGADAVTAAQARAWGAPYRQLDDGGQEAFGGVNSLKPLLQNRWGTRNSVLFYVQEYLTWLADFYGQWPQVFGLAHFCAGNNYGQFEELDLDVEHESGGARLRADIAATEFVPKVAAWDWARQQSADPLPSPPPDRGREEPDAARVFLRARAAGLRAEAQVIEDYLEAAEE